MAASKRRSRRSRRRGEGSAARTDLDSFRERADESDPVVCTHLRKLGVL